MSHSLYTCGYVYTVELNRSLKVCIASADGLCRRVTSVQWPLRACGKDRLEYCSKVCKVSKIKKRSSTNLHMGLRTYIFPLLELEIRRTNLTCLPYIFVSVFSTACTYAHICRASPVNLTFFTASFHCMPLSCKEPIPPSQPFTCVLSFCTTPNLFVCTFYLLTYLWYHPF